MPYITNIKLVYQSVILNNEKIVVLKSCENPETLFLYAESIGNWCLKALFASLEGLI